MVYNSQDSYSPKKGKGMAKYISEIIPPSEIDSWRWGDRVLITAQTGSGKTNWVKNILYAHAKKRKKKILLLSNRNVLKRQNEHELADKKDVITLKNYQSIETRILEHGQTISEVFEHFDYIVFDEAHYWFSDSSFNRNTDLLMGTVKDCPDDKVFIYMTATPDVLLSYHDRFEHKYPKREDEKEFFNYNFIQALYFYNDDGRVENILDSIPFGEKAIYFSSAATAYRTAYTRNNSVFVCSENNEEYGKYSSKETLKSIEETGQFEQPLLCTTTVLDTGLSISDETVKHIILDIVDPVTLIQAIGRIRISGEQKINVYIKNRHNGQIHFHLKEVKRIFKFATEMLNLKKSMSPEEAKKAFQRKYARRDFDNIIQNDFEVNYAKFYQVRYLKELFIQILTNKSKDGYKKFICSKLGMTISSTKVMLAEETFEKRTIENVLQKYIGKKLFKEEQEQFKEDFFECLFSPKRHINYRHRGIISINSILQEDGKPYTIVSNRDWKESRRGGKRYWSIIKTEPP